jgi:hypothetical protein
LLAFETENVVLEQSLLNGLLLIRHVMIIDEDKFALQELERSVDRLPLEISGTGRDKPAPGHRPSRSSDTQRATSLYQQHDKEQT